MEPTQLIDLANRLARVLARLQPGITPDDLAGAAILAAVHTPTRYIRGAVIDAMRAETRRRPQQLGFDDQHIYEPAYVVRLALKRCGVLMLNCLEGSRRRVILLRYWWMLTQEETADEIGVSPGRVGQLEREARNTIAAELARRGIRSLRDVM